jgi:hypothetical protein
MLTPAIEYPEIFSEDMITGCNVVTNKHDNSKQSINTNTSNHLKNIFLNQPIACFSFVIPLAKNKNPRTQ